jgi:hypothetical protein
MAYVAPSSSDLPKCPCGFDKNHGLVRKQAQYSTAGTLLLVFAGAIARPKRIDYVCPRCKTVIESVTDPDVLKKHH